MDEAREPSPDAAQDPASKPTSIVGPCAPSSGSHDEVAAHVLAALSACVLPIIEPFRTDTTLPDLETAVAELAAAQDARPDARIDPADVADSPDEPDEPDENGLVLGPHGRLVPVPVAKSLERRMTAAQAAGDGALDVLELLDRLECLVHASKAAALTRLLAARSAEETIADLEAAPADRCFNASTAKRSAVAEAGAILRMPERTANELCARSTMLVQERPATFEALRQGRLSWRHAVVVLDDVLTLQATAKVSPKAVDAFEHALVDGPVKVSVSVFRSRARRLREQVHPESIQTRSSAARQDRRMDLSPAPDGMAWLNLYLGAETAQGIWTQCTRAARACQGPDESRTLTQLRVDAAAALLLTPAPTPPVTVTTVRPGATGASAGGYGAAIDAAAAGGALVGAPTEVTGAGGAAAAAVDGPGDRGALGFGASVVPRAQVLVTVPLLTLLGIGSEPAELEGYGPIATSIARRLLADAPSFWRVLTDPTTGEPLTRDPDRYRVTQGMRLVLRARDRTCTFVNCNTVTADTALDHLLAREHGGLSVEDNLGHECLKHHLLKHAPDGKDRHGKPQRHKKRLPQNRYGQSGRSRSPNDDCAETSVGMTNETPRRVTAGTAPSREASTTARRHDGPDLQPNRQAAPRQGRPRPAAPGSVRGWVPAMTDSSGIGWTSPSGRDYPPQPREFRPPEFPPWLLELITDHGRSNQAVDNTRRAQERQAELDARQARERLRNQPPPF